MNCKAFWVVGACVSSLGLPQVAEACGGGGVVTSHPGTLGANAQRVFIAVHDDGIGGGPDGTDVVTVIDVPATTADYGALLPLPSAPTLDPMPVSTEEFAELDAATAPQITVTSESDGGGGIGCMCAGSAAGSDKEAPLRASEPVTIGPVSAVVLDGTTAAVNTWLADNGFAISAADQAMISDYAGYYFVAIKRSDTAALGGPTSIGIHFTMADDHRELPLRFASLGAAPTVAFTLFLATSDNVGPSAPFVALTLNDLDGMTLATKGYPAAVQGAVSAHGNQAFVLESRTPSNELGLYGTRLRSLLGGATTLTRMTTILPAAALTEDAHFYSTFDADVPNHRYLGGHTPGAREAGVGSLAVLLLLGLRRRARPAQSS